MNYEQYKAVVQTMETFRQMAQKLADMWKEVDPSLSAYPKQSSPCVIDMDEEEITFHWYHRDYSFTLPATLMFATPEIQKTLVKKANEDYHQTKREEYDACQQELHQREVDTARRLLAAEEAKKAKEES